MYKEYKNDDTRFSRQVETIHDAVPSNVKEDDQDYKEEMGKFDQMVAQEIPDYGLRSKEMRGMQIRLVTNIGMIEKEFKKKYGREIQDAKREHRMRMW